MDNSTKSPYIDGGDETPDYTFYYIAGSVILIILIILYLYFSGNASWFLGGVERSDPESDENYLEHNIGLLNKMQDKNRAC